MILNLLIWADCHGNSILKEPIKNVFIKQDYVFAELGFNLCTKHGCDFKI